jgi:uncharacterized protein (TIGR01244 family)
MKIFKQPKNLSALLLSVSLLAAPVFGQSPSIRNFHQVNEKLYRSGQPTPDAWIQISKMGVKTVIDLRRDGEEEHSVAAESAAVTAVGMKYVNVPMKGVVAPSNEQIIKILALMDSNEPVLVHCKRGADRTGTVIACYRMARNNWQREQALKEAKSLGMGMAQFGMKRYIMAFQPSMFVSPTTAAAAAPAVQ